MLTNTTHRIIEWGDCDPAGIVFNPNFFSFFDHCTALLYTAAGWPKPEMLKTFDAAGVPLVKTQAEFRAPCMFGNEVAIKTSIVDVRRSSFDVKHELFKGDTCCVIGNETRVWTVRNPENGGIKSAPIPQEVVARFNSA